jgi:ArsR family transcriptional regulator
MRVLVQAGLVDQKRIKQWAFYRRNEERLAEIKEKLLQAL